MTYTPAGELALSSILFLFAEAVAETVKRGRERGRKEGKEGGTNHEPIVPKTFLAVSLTGILT